MTVIRRSKLERIRYTTDQITMSRRIRRILSHNTSLIGPLAVIITLLAIAAVSKGYVADVVLLFENVIAEYGALGQVFFVCIFFAAALSGFFPLSILAVLAGVAYGLLHGFFLAAVGIILGASGAFLLGRYALRSSIDRWVGKRVSLKRLDSDIGAQGWKIVGLLRLSPITPFSIASYAFSMTKITFPQYLVGTIASLPALFAYVYTGSISSVALHALLLGELKVNAVQMTVMGAGFIATVFAALFLIRLTRKALSSPLSE